MVEKARGKLVINEVVFHAGPGRPDSGGKQPDLDEV